MGNENQTVPAGLAAPEAVASYQACVAGQQLDQMSMAPADRANAVIACANQELGAAGLPGNTLAAAAPGGTASGVFDFADWSIGADLGDFSDAAMARGGLGDASNTIYHESRHSEQWYQMARMQAGLNPGQPLNGVDPAMQAAAALDPITQCDPSTAGVESWYESVYGGGAANRNQVLTNLGTPAGSQAAYCALPEEADAWAIANGVSPSSCQ